MPHSPYVKKLLVRTGTLLTRYQPFHLASLSQTSILSRRDIEQKEEENGGL